MNAMSTVEWSMKLWMSPNHSQTLSFGVQKVEWYMVIVNPNHSAASSFGVQKSHKYKFELKRFCLIIERLDYPRQYCD